ncbi:hypothetical protein Fmac_022569 [Flemingia macrophylla]|uniref:Uncharacterized protein n=1 Tax=Flemingia macrophylla TaxID=520843 RepID=A0ABD1M034_9FABA
MSAWEIALSSTRLRDKGGSSQCLVLGSVRPSSRVSVQQGSFSDMLDRALITSLRHETIDDLAHLASTNRIGSASSRLHTRLDQAVAKGGEPRMGSASARLHTRSRPSSSRGRWSSPWRPLVHMPPKTSASHRVKEIKTWRKGFDSVGLRVGKVVLEERGPNLEQGKTWPRQGFTLGFSQVIVEGGGWVLGILQYTCPWARSRYNRLGKNADEADAEEIIKMANKASFADQQIQVQIKTFCTCMDEIFLPNEMMLNDHLKLSQHANSSPHHSGLSSAITVPKQRRISQAEVSQKLKTLLGFTLNIKPSQVSHKDSGRGLFLDGAVDVGAVHVLAF